MNPRTFQIIQTEGIKTIKIAVGIIFILILSTNAFAQWAYNIGEGNNDVGESIAVDSSGNVYITGYFSGSNVDFGGGNTLSSNGDRDIYFAKYDTNGNYQWAHNIGESGQDYGQGIAVDSSGNVYITGRFQGSNVDFDPGAGTHQLSSSGADDIYFAKYDTDGYYQWAHSVGGSSQDVSLDIAVDSTGDVYITGFFRGSNVDLG